MKEPLDVGFQNWNEITIGVPKARCYYRSVWYTTDNYAKGNNWVLNMFNSMNNLFPIYADFDNAMHKINTDRLQQRFTTIA